MTTTYRIGAVGHAMGYHLVDDSTGKDIDISLATLLEIVLRRPNGSKIVRVGTLVSGGKTGRFQIILNGDFDIHGFWRREGHVETPTLTETSSSVRFLVVKRL